ncbi:MAG: type II toxin-antitoxin system HicB family antitoxin [Planctomycetaceae bacterium]|nr:type II toxin-antitoxin system HicB family antitoxin [Planctomycetaceae bacterium]
MKIKVILHDAEEGGYWASVPSLPGCFSQGETREETLANIREAIECYLDAPDLEAPATGHVEVVEV